MRWSVYTLIFINVGLSVSSIIVVIASCIPISKFWDLEGTAPGKCMDSDAQQTFYEVNGILNIILDILIYIVPMPTLWSVKISNVRDSLSIMPSVLTTTSVGKARCLASLV